MKRYLYIIIVLFSFNSFGQTSIKGVVSTANDGAQPGVSIVEVGTTNGTVTNFDGYYEIAVTDTNSVLIYSFVGLINKTVTIGSKKEINVQLELDTKALDDVFFGCYSPVRYTEIGFASGVYYTPVGFKIKNQTPYIWGINLDLESSFTYRQKDENEYISLFLKEKSLFTLMNSGVGIMGEFRKFSFANKKFKEFILAPSYGALGFLWTVGYTNQSRKLADLEETRIDGVFIGITKFFPFAFNLSAKSQYLQDIWQFDIEFSKHFYRPNLTVGIGYERLYMLDEFDFTLSYRIEY